MNILLVMIKIRSHILSKTTGLKIEVNATLCDECLFTIIMSFKCKQSVLSIKDKQDIILRLEKEEKRTNLLAEYGVSKRQISDKIITFADMCTGVHNGQWRCRPYCFSNDLQMFCFTIKCRFLNVISFCSSLICIFSIIPTLDYPDYFV